MSASDLTDHERIALAARPQTQEIPMQTQTTIATRQQYLAGEISHHDYYSQFVTEDTRSLVERTFGASTLRAALHQDQHLNSIDLRSWDALSWTPIDDSGKYRHADLRNDSGRFHASIAIDREAANAAGETITRAVLVCIAKTAARQIVQGQD